MNHFFSLWTNLTAPFRAQPLFRRSEESRAHRHNTPRALRATAWFCFLLLTLLVLTALASAQDKPNAALEKVLTQMDTTAAGFHSAEASFVWDQYQKVVDETDTQKGKVYFRRAGKETQMMADIAEPDQKFVLYSDGKIQVYQPKIEQVTIYSPGKNKADIESFLVLGFGGGGHDLLKSFTITYEGAENLNGTDTAKLDLVPKSTRTQGMVERITLWVDPSRGVSVQQKLFQPGGDFRLAKYSDVQLNHKLADTVFKLKTTGKTRFVSPQG